MEGPMKVGRNFMKLEKRSMIWLECLVEAAAKITCELLSQLVGKYCGISCKGTLKAYAKVPWNLMQRCHGNLCKGAMESHVKVP